MGTIECVNDTLNTRQKEIYIIKCPDYNTKSWTDNDHTNLGFLSPTDVKIRNDTLPTQGPSIGDEFVPRDGGWGWLVCLCSFYTNGMVSGLMNSFGIIYVVMLDEYAPDDPNISFKTCKYIEFIAVQAN